MGDLKLAPGLALIFDLDGVLLDSMELHTRAWEVYLERLGMPADGITARMHGKRNDQILIDLFGGRLTPGEVSEHGAAKERLFREIMDPVFFECLVPGVTRFLERTEGAPVGLGSNAEPPNVDYLLDKANIRKYFCVIVDGHQVKEAKPAPEVYLTVAARMGIEARNCVIFEDSPGGVRAARAAGARVVGIETHLDPVPGVDLSIADFLDVRLEPWLLQQRPC